MAWSYVAVAAWGVVIATGCGSPPAPTVVRPEPLSGDGVCQAPDAEAPRATGSFVEVGAAAGLAGATVRRWPDGQPFLGRDATNGASSADVDGDGDVDLFVIGWAGGSALYRNDGTAHFVRDERSGVPVQPAAAAAFCDLDNDGDEDLLLSPFPDPAAPDGPHLFWNDGKGHFTDATAGSGFGRRTGLVTSFRCGDYDGDGRTDVYLSRGNLTFVNDPANELLHNLGGGRFEDVAHALGVDDLGWTWATLFSDVDGDGNPDLLVADDNFVSHVFGGNASGSGVYRNGGAAAGFRFTRSDPFGPTINGDLMGIAVGDYDHDGRQDYDFTDIGVQHLLHDAGGGLKDVAYDVGASLNPADQEVGWATRFLDFDQDGWADLFIACGPLAVLPYTQMTENGAIENRPAPLFLLRNRGDGRFDDVTLDHGFGAPLMNHTATAADLDLDGDLDFVVGRRGGDLLLFRNDVGGKGHWLKLRLHGTASARDAIGARVTVVAGALRQTLEVGPNGNAHTSDDLTLHAGLGPARSADVDIRWPSGRAQSFHCVAADRFYDVTEPR